MTRTSPRKTDDPRSRRVCEFADEFSNGIPNGSARGFTLVELLVVIALIALLTLFALPSISNIFKVSLDTTTRQLASIIKEGYNSAVITGRVHRIVYDIDNKQFWVETGPNTVLLDTAESKEKETIRKRFAKPNETPPPSGFDLDETVTRAKIDLPRGVEFEDIVTEQNKDPIKAGSAYTHFFPHGMSEQTLIHLKDSDDHQVSLVISTLIGKTELKQGYVKAEDVFGQKK